MIKEMDSLSSNMEDNYVSIIFIHYAMNEERSMLARASLKSLQETVHTPAEIIVIDNGDNIEDSQFFLKQCQEKKITHYIRNADNLHFSFARNQGILHSNGKWVVIVDNDIMYKDHWLELCMKAIERFPDEKRIASPINYPYVHSRDPRWRHGQLNINGRMFNLTERAGSNCVVMKREALKELGLFNMDMGGKAGSGYVDNWVNKGYLVITPSLNWAYDCGLRRGFNWTIEFKPEKTLSNGTKLEVKQENAFNLNFGI